MRIKKKLISISWSTTKFFELTLYYLQELYGWQSGELQIWPGSLRVNIPFYS